MGRGTLLAVLAAVIAAGAWALQGGAAVSPEPGPLAHVTAPVQAVAAQGALDDFRLIDHRGDSHGLGYYADQGIVTLVGASRDCARLDEVMGRVSEVQGLRFLVAADPDEDREAWGALVEAAGLDVRVLMDATTTVAPTVGLGHAGDVVRVDLEAFTWERVQDGFPDCPLPRADGQGLSYTEDVVPVIEDLCLECHSDRRKIPMFSDYDTLMGWSAMIRRTVRTQRMPPGGHDAYYGAVRHGFTQDQLATLVSWIDAGLPRGSEPDPLPGLNAAITSTSKRERWGKPDRVFRMSEVHELPAAGPDQYKYAQVSEPLEEDLWIRGIRLKLNLEVTHHVNVILLDKPLAEATDDWFRRGSSDMLRLRKTKGDHHHYEADERDERFLWARELSEERVLMTYGRSKRTVDFTPGMALKVPAGSVLVLEIHYGLTGKEETSEIKVLMYEHDDALPRTEVKRASFYRTGFKIPPGKKNHRVRTGIELDRDITLLEVVPHMHRRGRSARYIAVYPDGREEVLVSVPFFQYKFQPHWVLAEPKPLPAGTRLVTEMIYDNSAQNPINPDPDAWVENGNQRIEEMHLPRFYFLEGLHGGSG